MMETRIYQVDGMDCAGCAATVEKGVSRLADVQHVQVDFATGKMRLTGDVAEAALRERLEALGYRLGDRAQSPAPVLRRGGVRGFWAYLTRQTETRLALAGGALILLGLIAHLLGMDGRAVNIILTFAALVAGYPIARSGINGLRLNHDFNINMLMTIAAVGAFVIGELLEGATVIFLFAIGEALEGYTADRARDSLRGLVELAPPSAVRLDETGHSVVPVEALRVDDTILVRPGERVPMDGVVLSGESDVDQAPITGESIPVFKTQDAQVFAGTVNGGGALTVRVTHLAADTTLSRIIRLVEEAQSTRAPSQRLIDQFARWYTPAVVLVALFVAVVPPLVFGAPFWNADGVHGWLYRALALLVIACPCALVISAPVTIISAITAAARRGVLIKGGAFLEALGAARAFAFDKTGTLTRGQPVVTARRSVDCTTGESCSLCDDVLALAAAVEQGSAHPLARAVVSAAQNDGLIGTYAPAQQVESLAGLGVRGLVNESPVTVGSHRLFDRDYPHDASLCALVQDAEASGQTAMLLADSGRVRGFVTVADAVRSDSRDVVAALKDSGAHIAMLTGDNSTVARAVGQQVGIADIRADLLPDDKLAAVRALDREYGGVVMIGDGINDTPALAAASVSVALGGAGSAQAMEAAGIVLMAGDLEQLPFAVRMARFARRLILQNVALSLGVKVIFVLLALAGGATLWMAILADVGMSMLVTLNGMRPLRGSLQG